MKRFPLVLPLILALFWAGCSKDNAIVDSVSPAEDAETSEMAPERTAYNPLDMTTLAEAREANAPEQFEATSEAFTPPELTKEEKDQLQAEAEALAKSGWYYYYFPNYIPCYNCWYWPGSMADVGVSSTNSWYSYYSSYARMGFDYNNFYPNGKVTGMRWRGYMYSGVWLAGFDENGQVVGTKYISGRSGWFDYTFYWSRPVSRIAVYNYDWYNYYYDMWFQYQNQGPVGSAGPDQTIVAGNAASLNGSGNDTDGGSVSFQWQDSNGTVISNSRTATTGTLTATGVYTFTFTVVDSDGGRVSDTMNVTVTNQNPVASAGADVDVVVGSGSTTLDASGSNDPDGHGISYEWKDGTGTTISTSATVDVGPFSSVGARTYSVTVSDAYGGSGSDEVVVTATNTDPDADAGSNQTILAGQNASIDGSGSSDADGHSLSYSWSSGEATATATVGPFNPGSYTFTLTVDDGYGGTDSDDLTITVTAIPVSFDIKPDDSSNQVNSKSKGVIPTAILGSADFDVTTIDVSSLAFGPAGAAEAHGKGHIEDVNGDGFDDLVLHFGTQESGLSKGDTSATLTGSTTDGWAFEGTDSVKVK